MQEALGPKGLPPSSPPPSMAQSLLMITCQNMEKHCAEKTNSTMRFSDHEPVNMNHVCR